MTVALLTTKLKIRRASVSGPMSRIDLVCEQDRWWVDAHGTVHDIAKIEPDYRRALLVYLIDNSFRMRRHRVGAGAIFGSLGDPYTELPDDWNPIAEARAWMAEQPLFMRLVELIALDCE